MLLHDDVQSFNLEKIRVSPNFLHYICGCKRIELEEYKYTAEEKMERTYSHRSKSWIWIRRFIELLIDVEKGIFSKLCSLCEVIYFLLITLQQRIE